jgi:beta-N-acetylhexosaminidase
MIVARCPFLVIDIDGVSLTSEEYSILEHEAIAGVVLFDRNDQDKSSLKALIEVIKTINPNIMIMVDQEGGTVQRLKRSFTKIPSLYSLCESYKSDPETTKRSLCHWARVSAEEQKDCGIDVNIAPVLDIHSDKSSIIGQRERAFHEDPRVIISLARLWIECYHDVGIKIVGKHFPGHGCVAGDTHTDVVVDNRSLGSIKQLDLLPYYELHDRLDIIMTAHVVYPQCDPDHTATTSKFWHNLLRDDIGFQGLVATDCLSMRGIAGGYESNLRNALSAGCDLVFMCHCRDELMKLLPRIQIKSQESLSGVATMV